MRMRDQISHFNDRPQQKASQRLPQHYWKEVYPKGGHYNDMMDRFNYPRKVLISEASLVVLGVMATWLLAWGSRIEDSGLRVLALGVTWVMDIAISLGIMVAVELQGGIIVFFIFRVVLLLCADSYEIGSTLLPALTYYGFFKIGTMVIAKMRNAEEADYRELEERPKFIENEQRRRDINTGLLSVCFIGIISMGMSSHPSEKTVLLLSVAGGVGVWVQLHLMSQSAGLQFRIISNTLSYNIYLFLLLLAGIGRHYYQDWLQLLLPAIAYLTTFFFIARVTIGSRSHKFQKSDQMLFEGSYAFKGDRGHKFYRQGSSSERILRVLDKLSRELLVIVYFLSFLAAVYRESYLWLPISIYLINAYPQQDAQPSFIVNYLQRKFNASIQLRAKLTIPIAILMHALLSRESSRREYLFDQLNQCQTASHIQTGLLFLLVSGAVLRQVMPQDLKSKTLRMLQLSCPLVCLGWVIWFECLHLRLVLLGLYVLAYCFESISATMRMRSKGGKSS